MKCPVHGFDFVTTPHHETARAKCPLRACQCGIARDKAAGLEEAMTEDINRYDEGSTSVDGDNSGSWDNAVRVLEGQ